MTLLDGVTGSHESTGEGLGDADHNRNAGHVHRTPGELLDHAAEQHVDHDDHDEGHADHRAEQRR